MNNSTAVAYVNKQGGTTSPKLNEIARTIAEFCESRSISVTAVHLPGTENTAADEASRARPYMSDWKLESEAFRKVSKRWPVNFDLFASLWNRQLTRFAPWEPQPGAEVVNAFAINWTSVKGYAFPPIALITRCLEKVRREEADLVLIAPVWPAQAWYPPLLSMICDTPILLETDPLLTAPDGRSHPLVATAPYSWPPGKCPVDSPKQRRFGGRYPTRRRRSSKVDAIGLRFSLEEVVSLV